MPLTRTYAYCWLRLFGASVTGATMLRSRVAGVSIARTLGVMFIPDHGQGVLMCWATDATAGIQNFRQGGLTQVMLCYNIFPVSSSRSPAESLGHHAPKVPKPCGAFLF